MADLMVSAHKNHYQNLGLNHRATPDEIKKAYRKLALIYHPDHNAKRRSAEERFKLLQQAYDTLSDPNQREQYDRLLSEQAHIAGQNDVSLVSRWKWSSLESHILPFFIGAVIGSLCGFKALADFYSPTMESNWWAVGFMGGGALVGGVLASIYFTRKNLG